MVNIDVSNVILAIIAVLSVVLVMMTEGFKLTLGFRSSETTQKRKQRIDKQLQEELDKKVDDFLKSEECLRAGPDRINGIEHWGYESLVAESITNDMLEGSDKKIKSGIKNFIVGSMTIFLVVLSFIYLDISNPFAVLIIVIFVILTGFLFWFFIDCAVKALKIRELFIKLDEKTTIEYADELNSEVSRLSE